MKLLWNIFMMGLTSLTVNAHAGEPTPLRLVQTIPLPNVEGRIDHIAVDLKGERLFVAALGNNTIEVLDLRAGKRIHSITGLHEPQGVGFIPESNKIYVANAKSGACGRDCTSLWGSLTNARGRQGCKGSQGRC